MIQNELLYNQEITNQTRRFTATPSDIDLNFSSQRRHVAMEGNGGNTWSSRSERRTACTNASLEKKAASRVLPTRPDGTVVKNGPPSIHRYIRGTRGALTDPSTCPHVTQDRGGWGGAVGITEVCCIGLIRSEPYFMICIEFRASQQPYDLIYGVMAEALLYRV